MSAGNSRESWQRPEVRAEWKFLRDPVDRMCMLDLIAHLTLFAVLVIRHGDLKRAAPYMCFAAFLNSRVWGLLSAGHPFPGLNLGLASDVQARAIANAIYKFKPEQPPGVWGTAYAGEMLALGLEGIS